MKLNGPVGTTAQGVTVDFYRRPSVDPNEPFHVTWKTSCQNVEKTQLLTMDETSVLWDHLLAIGYTRTDKKHELPFVIGAS